MFVIIQIKIQVRLLLTSLIRSNSMKNLLLQILVYIHNNYFQFFVGTSSAYNLNRYEYDLDFLFTAIICIMLYKQISKYTGSKFLDRYLKLFPLFYFCHSYFISHYTVVMPPELQIRSFFFMVDSTICFVHLGFIIPCYLFSFYYLFVLYNYLLKKIEEDDKRRAKEKERLKKGGN